MPLPDSNGNVSPPSCERNNPPGDALPNARYQDHVPIWGPQRQDVPYQTTSTRWCRRSPRVTAVLSAIHADGWSSRAGASEATGARVQRQAFRIPRANVIALIAMIETVRQWLPGRRSIVGRIAYARRRRRTCVVEDEWIFRVDRHVHHRPGPNNAAATAARDRTGALLGPDWHA